MTHYTILPWELIFEQEDEVQTFTEIELNGVLLQIRMEEGNRATIVRLLRGGLEDYLNPSIAPGQEIQYMPTLQNNK
ncbi:hypothetical protein J2Z69_002100 [Paenibacillus shirakamiensis]|uniref:YlzJ-like protein n=1 Tax=Paenibacillus shirakamiensis TaxID=1265935 RepID=A0ABS4JH63_9BACL|nr:YlzJ-like family protein [Paenibacillus shirakamiensis]MBP2001057.1 hypothetical protein [Paenibacillus shirakamiensis]